MKINHSVKTTSKNNKQQQQVEQNMEEPERSSIVTSSGLPCVLHTWKAKNPKGVAVVYHGFLAHARYPTVRYAAQLLCRNANLTVLAMDLPGHGLSPGTRGYINDYKDLIQDGMLVAREARKAVSNGPLFLAGSSLGGAIALSVANQASTTTVGDNDNALVVNGIILLGPMLAISVAEPLRYVLMGLATILPSTKLISSSASSSEAQYRDVQKRNECDKDELTIKGKLMPASASACVELANHIRINASSVQTPFLCMIAEQDVVVNNDGAHELMERAPVKDKTLTSYPALHGLLCEPEPLLSQIHKDILDWVQARI